VAEKTLPQGTTSATLAERLRAASASRSSSMLALQVGEEGWLVDLTDAGEVIPVPPHHAGAARQGRGSRA